MKLKLKELSDWPLVTLIDRALYKTGFSTPHLRCVAQHETTTILREVQEGYVAYHEGARSADRKILN